MHVHSAFTQRCAVLLCGVGQTFGQGDTDRLRPDVRPFLRQLRVKGDSLVSVLFYGSQA